MVVAIEMDKDIRLDTKEPSSNYKANFKTAGPIVKLLTIGTIVLIFLCHCFIDIILMKFNEIKKSKLQKVKK